jgi:tetratricopeptide (TPR) repeat protein
LDARDLQALAMVGLSRVALRDGDYAHVQSLASTALDIARDEGDDAQIMPLHLLAAGTRLDGRYEDALRLYEQSLDLNRRMKNAKMVTVELHNIGHVYLHLGRVADAERAFAERLASLGTPQTYDSAMTSLNQAAIAHARGDDAAATELVNDATAQLKAGGIELDPDDAFEVAWLRERLASTSGGDRGRP